MPKKGQKKIPKARSMAVDDSDDEFTLGNGYNKDDVPDPDSDDYYNDEIDDFHSARNKIPVEEDDEDEGNNWGMDDEEEVLALDSEESDDDDIRMLKSQLRRLKRTKHKEITGSDLEDEPGDDGLPDTKAWGKSRKMYYLEDDVDSSDLEEEEGEADLEEKEALALQKKLAEQMDDQDFGLDVFKRPETTEVTEGKEEKIVKDLSKLSKQEKLQLLKKESPELLTLIDDFKEKMAEVQTRLQPLRELIARKKYTGKAADYINTKFKLNLNYCINITFYLMLKAKHLPVHDHPVVQRLVQYRNLMKQLEPVDERMKDEVSEILEKMENGEDVQLGDPPVVAGNTFIRRKKTVKFPPSLREKALKKQRAADMGGDEDSDDLYEDLESSKPAKQKRKNLKATGHYETQDEKEALQYYDMMKKKGNKNEPSFSEGPEEEEEEDAMDAEDDLDEDGKRAISYQIQKNKGLTAHKKKALRNPRVKHRMKYRKAKISRKGQVREPRTEMKKYDGEISGIRAGIKRSVKFK